MNRYRLIQRIGNGGYSQVYKAFDNKSGKLCALKVMKHGYESCRASHDHQLMTLRKFTGAPAIIQLQDSFVEDGYLAMVFDIFDSNLIEFYKSVHQQERRPLSGSEICEIMLQLCLGIDALHRQGYAHRDIKSQNVLVQRKNGENGKRSHIEVKLVDFGLVKLIQKEENTNYIATRWYRSPELLLSMPYDKSIDIFALGCVMAELYAGIEPFRGFNSIDQLTQIFGILGQPAAATWPEGVCKLASMGLNFKHQKPKGLRSLVPSASSQAFDLLSQMLAINPKTRIKIGDVLRHPYFNSSRRSLQPQLEELFTTRLIQFQNPQHVMENPKGIRNGFSQPKLPVYSKDSTYKAIEGRPLHRPISFYEPKPKIHLEPRPPNPNLIQQRFQTVASPNCSNPLKQRQNRQRSRYKDKDNSMRAKDSINWSMLQSDLIRAKLKSLGEGGIFQKNMYLKKRTEAQNTVKEIVSKYNTQPFHQTNTTLNYKSVNKEHHCTSVSEDASSKQMLSLARISIKNPPAIPNLQLQSFKSPINRPKDPRAHTNLTLTSRTQDPLTASARLKVNRILQGFHHQK